MYGDSDVSIVARCIILNVIL